MTNMEWIQQASEDELVELFAHCDCDFCLQKDECFEIDGDCGDVKRAWLRREHTDEQ